MTRALFVGGTVDNSELDLEGIELNGDRVNDCFGFKSSLMPG